MQTMSLAARCIVKAKMPAGPDYWICPAACGGFRTLGSRDAAEVYASRLDAYTAIDSLPSVLSASGIAFTVESADSATSLMPSF
jgi:hypothetical protein